MVLSSVSDGEIMSRCLPRASGFPGGRRNVPASSVVPLCTRDSGRNELAGGLNSAGLRRNAGVLAFGLSPLLCCLSGGRVAEVCAATADPEAGSSHGIISG